MPRTKPSNEISGSHQVATGPKAAYDSVARAYDARLRGELDDKPLDRALLEAFVELVGGGTIADVGCGPGHITRFLATRHSDIFGIDQSPQMVEIARERAPGLAFTVGTMLQLPATDNSWSGLVALYSIIHLTPEQRAVACREFARTLRPSGWLLVAFHVDTPEFGTGQVDHVTSMFNEAVDLDIFFLKPEDVIRDIEAAGFTLKSTTIRQPWPEVEYPSRRCYLLAQRR